jgi:hypothetical protein
MLALRKTVVPVVIATLAASMCARCTRSTSGLDGAVDLADAGSGGQVDAREVDASDDAEASEAAVPDAAVTLDAACMPACRVGWTLVEPRPRYFAGPMIVDEVNTTASFSPSAFFVCEASLDEAVEVRAFRVGGGECGVGVRRDGEVTVQGSRAELDQQHLVFRPILDRRDARGIDGDAFDV